MRFCLRGSRHFAVLRWQIHQTKIMESANTDRPMATDVEVGPTRKPQPLYLYHFRASLTWLRGESVAKSPKPRAPKALPALCEYTLATDAEVGPTTCAYGMH